MQKVKDIDNYCLVTCQQRTAACELVNTKPYAVLASRYHVTKKAHLQLLSLDSTITKEFLVGVLN